MKEILQLAGSITIAVDPKYTSQACPKCGHTAKENRNKGSIVSIAAAADMQAMMTA